MQTKGELVFDLNVFQAFYLLDFDGDIKKTNKKTVDQSIFTDIFIDDFSQRQTPNTFEVVFYLSSRRRCPGRRRAVRLSLRSFFNPPSPRDTSCSASCWPGRARSMSRLQ